MSTGTLEHDAAMQPTEAAADPARATRFGWLRGIRSVKVIVGLVIVLVFALVAIFGPLLVSTDPSAVSNDILHAPSAHHLLGTSHNGQDIFAEMIYGTRVSMVVGFVAAILATILSLVVGLTAGYLGGVSDEVLSLITNIFLVIPGLPLVVILTGTMPNAGELAIVIVIAVTAWAWGARVLRAQTLSLRKRDFVEAARASGESTFRIIFREILPNETAIVAATFLSTVIGAILTQASLAFLGLTSVTDWSWGVILYWAQTQNAMSYGAWWWFVPPGLSIALIGTGLSLMNFGIDEFINPRLRSAGIATKRARKRAAGTRSRTGRPARPVAEPAAAGDGAAARGDVVLEIKDLRVDYLSGDSTVRAVDGVSLSLRRGTVLGIAGESGSGKSTLAYAITRLHESAAEIPTGQILYTAADGKRTDILRMSDRELTDFRWEELAIVFQSAMNALNPILKIGVQIEDAIAAHRPSMSERQRRERVAELLTMVGISTDRTTAYPHELSGGMRQRVMIAIALALNPEIIVMDEPTTALDVVIQRQIIDQIMELKDRLGFSVIFITHDLSMLIELADEIAIMYAGRIVEQASAQDFYRAPSHPYSRGLIGSFPTLSGSKRELTGIVGSPPDLRALPTGCSFSPRCPSVTDECRVREPLLLPLPRVGEPTTPAVDATSPGTRVACLLYQNSEPVAAAEADRS
ncbi:dipeptide/oligopeptide/nickel ABC transporter permease/ATP-binding protein [Rugosimonospora africana]|uniref:Peptide ABC transporter ATP-binding protein n=1 Tax=Rugosimonospora africana TaxID=556532 RepID=A0A8J3QWC3_9ACTN|nr:dipeptide/oligopeptide/nickel ABC transporter permease/ATP-binding protein [Rugosimonospora africana]GIH15936.1 peptide ABC transporter ATP-binding protein [Rugosimonospora africana]